MGAHEFICEPVLWTDWMQRGVLRASTECSLLTLDAARFQEISMHFFKLTEATHPAWYAEQFVEHLNDLDLNELTDLDQGFSSIINDLIAEAHPKAASGHRN